MKAQEIRLIKGRIVFVDANTMEPSKSPSTFPSALVIFDPKRKECALEVKPMDYRNSTTSAYNDVEFTFA